MPYRQGPCEFLIPYEIARTALGNSRGSDSIGTTIVATGSPASARSDMPHSPLKFPREAMRLASTAVDCTGVSSGDMFTCSSSEAWGQ